MKIGFFCNEYPPRPHGGIGTFVHMLALQLARAGHSVAVAQWGESEREESQDGVRIVTIRQSGLRHIAWLVNRLRLWRWLRREARDGRIEVFEIPEYQGCLPFPLAACPVVVRLHLAESHIRAVMGGRRGRIYWLEKATLFWHRHWIGVSRYILEETQRFFALRPRQSAVIHNPAPTVRVDALASPPSRPARYVLYVGSVSERKGALLLAEAMRQVLARGHDVHLVYVGPETVFRGKLISHAIRDLLGEHASRVIFTGRVSHREALAWMRDAVAVVLVSRIESFGLVLSEAMSLGVPVVGGDCGPGAELIEHGVTGLLVSLDAPADLARAICHLLQNPSWARKLGEAGQQKVEAVLHLSTCVDRTLAFYRDIVV